MAKTYSCLLIGLEVVEIEIETMVGLGFSGLTLLGLKSDIVRDMRERVRSALESIGIPIPAKRVVINISSQDILKLSRTPLQELDFAVAACIIIALFDDQNIPLPKMDKEYFAGELTLTGQIKPVQNKLLYEKIAANNICNSPNTDHFSISLNLNNQQELYQSEHFEIYASLADWLSERKNIRTKPSQNILIKQNTQNRLISEQDILSVLETIKILLKNPKACVSVLLSVAGHHHLLLAGEPGIGKSFAVHKIKNILLPPSIHEQIEIKLIHPNKYNASERPFRSPHHSSSVAALIGGQSLKPGEATLAHHGVLFLDEVAEFSRHTLDSLREPLDSGKVELSRSIGNVSYPAKFLLCATANPCPCGYFLSKLKPCQCMPSVNRKYLSKLSGPFLDRFCLQVWLQNPNHISNDQKDIFANYLLSLNDEQLYVFAKNFLIVQRDTPIPQVNDVIPQSYNTISNVNQSLRAQNKIYRLSQTFSRLFPSLLCENNFTQDILKYRNFSQMIDKDLVY